MRHHTLVALQWTRSYRVDKQPRQWRMVQCPKPGQTTAEPGPLGTQACQPTAARLAAARSSARQWRWEVRTSRLARPPAVSTAHQQSRAVRLCRARTGRQWAGARRLARATRASLACPHRCRCSHRHRPQRSKQLPPQHPTAALPHLCHPVLPPRPQLGIATARPRGGRGLRAAARPTPSPRCVRSASTTAWSRPHPALRSYTAAPHLAARAWARAAAARPARASRLASSACTAASRAQSSKLLPEVSTRMLACLPRHTREAVRRQRLCFTRTQCGGSLRHVGAMAGWASVPPSARMLRTQPAFGGGSREPSMGAARPAPAATQRSTALRARQMRCNTRRRCDEGQAHTPSPSHPAAPRPRPRVPARAHTASLSHLAAPRTRCPAACCWARMPSLSPPAR